MGRGQTIGVDLEASPIKQTISLSFIEPWLLGVPWSVGLSLSLDHETVQNVLQDFVGQNFTDAQASIAAPDPYNSRADYLAAVAAGQTIPLQYLMTYDMWNFTLGANSGYVFTFPFGRLGFQGGYNPQLRRIDYDSTLFRPFDVAVRQNNGTWNFIDQVNLGVYLDGRDIYWNPTKGYYIGQNVTYTGGIPARQQELHSDRFAPGRVPHPSRCPAVRDLESPVRARRAYRPVSYPPELRFPEPDMADDHRQHGAAVH